MASSQSTDIIPFETTVPSFSKIAAWLLRFTGTLAVAVKVWVTGQKVWPSLPPTIRTRPSGSRVAVCLLRLIATDVKKPAAGS